jgi:sporulation protein YlmC with PRC-barrel domain
MKWIKTLTVMASLLSLLLATMAVAATPQMSSNLFRGSKLIGADVENPQGENLGDIKDVVIDQDGRVTYVVLAFGGFLGLGEKYYAIPWAALTPEAGQKPGDRNRYILNVDKERLKNAPGFDRNNWPDMADRTWGEQIYAYYGITPYWQARGSQLSSATTPGMGTLHSATVAATVQEIDQSSKLIRLKTANNEIVEMQAPAGLLNTLQAGDRVEVVIRKDMPR